MKQNEKQLINLVTEYKHTNVLLGADVFLTREDAMALLQLSKDALAVTDYNTTDIVGPEDPIVSLALIVKSMAVATLNMIEPATPSEMLLKKFTEFKPFKSNKL